MSLELIHVFIIRELGKKGIEKRGSFVPFKSMCNIFENSEILYIST